MGPFDSGAAASAPRSLRDCAAGGHARGHVAPRRGTAQDHRQEPPAVAGGRPSWAGAGPPRPGAARPARRGAPSAPRAGRRTGGAAGGGHRSAGRLPTRPAARAPSGGAPTAHGTPQPSRKQPPPGPKMGARAATAYVTGARAALPGALERRLQSLPPPPPSPFRSSVPRPPRGARPAMAAGRAAHARGPNLASTRPVQASMASPPRQLVNSA
jgi:hypothetical protein